MTGHDDPSRPSEPLGEAWKGSRHGHEGLDHPARYRPRQTARPMRKENVRGASLLAIADRLFIPSKNGGLHFL